MYTVEEAARIIRVGRTKAYAMTQEWRATGGRSGLPVVDFGNVLRVPRRALEELFGVDLADAAGGGESARAARDTGTDDGSRDVEPEPVTEEPTLVSPARPSRRSRNLPHAANQLDLFGPAAS
jgi:hypothetical protein